MHLAAGAAMLPAISHFAWSQDYPTRQVTLIAPWPAGGAVDALSEIVDAEVS
jgi:tripartite-type tricarboxylate transporter receptor subunit TctC